MRSCYLNESVKSLAVCDVKFFSVNYVNFEKEELYEAVVLNGLCERNQWSDKTLKKTLEDRSFLKW